MEKWFIPTCSVQRQTSHSGNNYFMNGRCWGHFKVNFIFLII